MPATPIASNQNLMLAVDDPNRRPGVDGEIRDAPPDGVLDAGSADGVTNRTLSVAGEDPGVGLTQKGTDEDAVVRRETDI